MDVCLQCHTSTLASLHGRCQVSPHDHYHENHKDNHTGHNENYLNLDDHNNNIDHIWSQYDIVSPGQKKTPDLAVLRRQLS